MTAYNSVFKRVEKKYRIDVAERAAVEAAAERLMAVDDYGRTRITSLYLDTPERAMIARSVEKPLYKEKLRLRAYGDAAGVASWELSVPGRLCVSQVACRFPMGKWKRGWLRGYEWRGRPQGCKWRLLPPGCRRWAMLMGMPWEVSRRAGRALERRFGATVCQRASLCFLASRRSSRASCTSGGSP